MLFAFFPQFGEQTANELRVSRHAPACSERRNSLAFFPNCPLEGYRWHLGCFQRPRRCGFPLCNISPRRKHTNLLSPSTEPNPDPPRATVNSTTAPVTIDPAAEVGHANGSCPFTFKEAPRLSQVAMVTDLMGGRGGGGTSGQECTITQAARNTKGHTFPMCDWHRLVMIRTQEPPRPRGSDGDCGVGRLSTFHRWSFARAFRSQTHLTYCKSR